MKTRRQEFRGSRGAAGVAAVEFVIAVPLLIFVALAVAELGRAFVQYDKLSYAVRSSARYVSENAIDYKTGEVMISELVAGRARNLAVYGTTSGGGTPGLPGFKPGHVSVLRAGENDIEVTATYPYQPLIGTALPLFGGDSAATLFTMKIAVVMRAIS